MQIIRLRLDHATVCIETNESQASFLGNLLFPRTGVVSDGVIIRERLMSDDRVSRFVVGKDGIVKFMLFGHWLSLLLTSLGKSQNERRKDFGAAEVPAIADLHTFRCAGALEATVKGLPRQAKEASGLCQCNIVFH